MRLAVVVTLVAAAASPALADADSLIDHLGPSEIGVGEAKRAGAIGALATRLNPAGLPLSTELVFDGGYGYRPSDRASLVSLAACDSTNAVPGCFYYTYVGAEPEVEGEPSRTRAHTGGLTLSRPVSSRLILGAGVKYFDVEADEMDVGSGFNWDVGAVVRLTETANIGAVGYNLWGAESAQFPRAVGAGVLLRPMPQLAASFDAVWNLDAEDGTGRYGGGLEYFATAARGMYGYPLRLGALHDVGLGGTHLTAGIGLASLKMGIDLAARRQVAGGDELLITAAIRVYGPRVPSRH
jgi:hypothetical protein